MKDKSRESLQADTARIEVRRAGFVEAIAAQQKIVDAEAAAQGDFDSLAEIERQDMAQWVANPTGAEPLPRTAERGKLTQALRRAAALADRARAEIEKLHAQQAGLNQETTTITTKWQQVHRAKLVEAMEGVGALLRHHAARSLHLRIMLHAFLQMDPAGFGMDRTSFGPISARLGAYLKTLPAFQAEDLAYREDQQALARWFGSLASDPTTPLPQAAEVTLEPLGGILPAPIPAAPQAAMRTSFRESAKLPGAHFHGDPSEAA